jgi:predicted dehydrogenase
MQGSAVTRAAHIVVRGCGSIGVRHLHILRDRLHLDPIALPARSSRASDLQMQGFRTVADWREVAANPPQFAIIATDTSRHLADVCTALSLGAHVLAEKPLAPTMSGIREMADIAARCGRRVFVACGLRFEVGLGLFREQLPQIGRVHAVRIECQSFLPEWRPGTDYRSSYSARGKEGGVLRDLIHEIDYAIWLFGAPKSLFAHLRNSGSLGIESDESADIFWESQSGASLSIRLDYLSRIPRRKMRAWGERGDLEWDYIGKRVTLNLAGQAEKLWSVDQERDEMIRDQIVDFLRVAEAGGASPLATLEEGAFAVAVCDTARKSSESNRVEPVLDWRSA